MMDNVSSFRRQTLARIRALAAASEQATIEEQIEVAATLDLLAKEATAAINDLKDNIREEAKRRLHGEYGNVDIAGPHGTSVRVFVVEPRLVLGKDADPVVLRHVLGEEFDLYFEERVTYKPRREAGERILKVASADRKDLLLRSVETQEQTPRVSLDVKED